MEVSHVISGPLLESLAAAIDNRNVQEGRRLLAESLPLFAELTPDMPMAGASIGLLAQAREAGFDDDGVLERVLTRFPLERWTNLALPQYVEVRLAAAALAMESEDIAEAMNHLDFVLAIGPQLAGRKPAALANFWKARGLRKAGEYDWALQFAQRAREIAGEIPLPKLAAVIQTLESWLLFQKGATKEALRVLQEAESVMHDTDDYLTLGNIQSAYGRIARRRGRYEHAIRYFDASIDLFREKPSLERHYGRSLANMAKAKRLLAGELRRRIETALEQRQNGRAEANGEGNHAKARELERMRQLLEEAQAALAEAHDIYQRFPSYHGEGNVQIAFAEIDLDLGHLDEADNAARRAFELGMAKTDYLLMCRARIAQAMTANARYEDQVGEEDASRFAQLAYDCAREAVDFAEHTQSRRILARAYTSQGLVLTNGFFKDPEVARSSANKAEEHLSDRHGALWDDLQQLRGRILRGSKLDPDLQAWSQGVVGDKSLQQVVEDFEALLVSKVWERESRKVSRVAKKLSVSPKKVRRLLRQLGLMPGHQ